MGFIYGKIQLWKVYNSKSCIIVDNNVLAVHGIKWIFYDLLIWSSSHIDLSIIRNKRSVILHYWVLTVREFFFNEYFSLYVKKMIKLNYCFMICSGFKEIKKFSTKRNLQITMERKNNLRNWKFLSHIWYLEYLYQ